MENSAALLRDELSDDEFVEVATAALSGHPRLAPTAPEVGALLRVALRAEDIVSAISGGPTALFDGLDSTDERLADVLEDLRQEGEARRAVLQLAMLTSRAVGQLLGSTSVNPRPLASERRRAGDLVGVPAGNRYHYPAFQFDVRGRRVWPAVAQANRLLGARGDPWGVASWWATPNGRIEARTPIDLVGTDEDDRLVALAEGEATASG